MLLPGIGLVAGMAYAQGSPAKIEIVVPDEACRQIIGHIPADDVAYRPGIDAEGRPVVPADLNPLPAGAVPDALTIALDIDVAAGFGIPRPPFGAPVNAGLIVVQGNDVFLNGRPLGDPLERALATLCRRPGR